MTRRLRATLLIWLVLMPLAVVSTATPASAANCATAGHSYVIDSSGFYQSGFEGDYRFGIQYLVLPAGTAFQVGGNGMLPDSFAEFNLYPGDTVPPWVRVQQLTRPKVGGNCVVNQRWVFPSAQLLGTHQVRVDYRAGRTGTPISETIVFIIFI